MPQQYEYAFRLKPDDNGTLLVTSPDFPELATFGENEIDATTRAAEALRDVIGQYMDRGIAIPAPSKPKHGMRVVALPVQLAAKVALWQRVHERKEGQRQVAAELGMDKTQLRRLMDPRQSSRFDDVEAALAKLGGRLALTVQPVAVKRAGKLTIPVFPGLAADYYAAAIESVKAKAKGPDVRIGPAQIKKIVAGHIASHVGRSAGRSAVRASSKKRA